MSDEQGYLEDDFLGFLPIEVNDVVENYVCAVCHGSLVSFQVPNERISIIVCLEHGNVEKCGRVMKSTVSIELERGYRDYQEVIRNLPDLWGSLIEKGFQYEKAKKIRKEYVCKKCGHFLLLEMIIGSENVNLVCPVHGNINQAGYIKKGEYHADLRTNR